MKLFLLLDWGRKLTLLEAYFCLGLARIIKQFPLSRTAALLGEKSVETGLIVHQKEKAQLSVIAESIHMMCRYTFWESECLVRAIAAQMMLHRRNIASTLYLGTGKDETGELTAHAWLRSGPYYITGGEGRETFTTVAMFAKEPHGVTRDE